MRCFHISNNLFRCGFDAILDFFYKISNVPLFDIWIMPIVGKFMSRFVTEWDLEIISKIFRFYADLCSKRRPIWNKGNKEICMKRIRKSELACAI